MPDEIANFLWILSKWHHGLTLYRKEFDMRSLKSIHNSIIFTWQTVMHVKRKSGILKLIRAAYRASPLLLYLPAHIRLMRTLNSLPVLELTKRHPKLGYKYLYRPYLVQCLTKKSRLEILQFHYAYLGEVVNNNFFSQIYDGNYEIWRDSSGEMICSISLSFPVDWEHDYEGDLLLTFHCDEQPAYTVTFTIASGNLIGLAAETLILVTAIQGKAGMAEQLKKIKKNYGDLSAPTLLISSVEGVARALGIHAIAGIGLDQQVQKQTWENEQFTFDYDQFWCKAIGERTNEIYYLQSIPAPQRPLEEIQSKHRKKTLFRRQIKASVQSITCLDFQRKCLKNVNS